MGIKEQIKKRKLDIFLFTRKQTFITLLVFQCLVILFIILFCSIKYEVSDDFIIELILSGGFKGNPDWHLIFSNPLLGFVLYPFYLINSSISWYYIFQLILCFASYVSISWVLSDKYNKLLGMIVTVILTMATAGDLYILPQFTKTAAVALVAGSLLFLQGIFSDKKVLTTILGGLLIIFGSLLRFNAIYIIAFFVLIVIVIYMIRSFKEEKQKIQWALKRILPSLLLIGILVGLNELGNYLHVSAPAYEDYWEYNAVRSTIVDYSYSDYSELKEDLDKIDVNENDYFLLKHWCFGDTKKYDIDTMQSIANVLNEHRNGGILTIGKVIEFLKDRQYKNYSLIWWLLLLGVICIFSNWKKFWIPVLSAIAVLFYIILFYHLGRCVYRVEFGFLFAAGAIMAWATDRNKTSAIESIRSVASILLAGLAVGSALTIWLPKPAANTSVAECRDNIQKYLYKSGDYKIEKYSVYMDCGHVYGNFIQLVEDNPQNVYMMEFSTTIQTLYYNFSPFNSAASVFPDNLFWTGGVITEHPATNSWLEAHEYENIYTALLEDNVYYVGNWWSNQVLTYLHENGYPNSSVEYIETVDGYDIYKFHE